MTQSVSASNQRIAGGERIVAVVVLCLTAALLLFPSVAAAHETPHFAVEIARMRSLQGAQALSQGLVAQGFQAYWMRTQTEALYGVRIGDFQNLDHARAFAARLLNSGFLNACAITYQDPQERKAGEKREEFLTALRQVGWKVGVNQDFLNASPRRATPANDIVMRIWAVQKNRWRLQADPEILSRAAASRPRGPNALPTSTIAGIASGFSQTMNQAALSFASLTPGVNSKAASAAEMEIVEADSDAIFSLRRANAGGTTPRLRGAVEMLEGQFVVRLKNLDRLRPFDGTAQVTVSDGRNENEIAPFSLSLRPNEERIMPIENPTLLAGDSVLIVYDGKRAIQLIRSAPFGDRPAVAAQPTPEPPPETVAIGMDMSYNSIGEDNAPTDDAAAASATQPTVTEPFEGEIEGAPALNKPKPNN